jgi:hypothetical protein
VSARPDELEVARLRAESTLADLRAARACSQIAQARLLRAQAAWLEASVEHAAAEQRIAEAGATAQRACDDLARLRVTRERGAA